MILRLSVIILFLILGFEYDNDENKSPWLWHVPSVETQMMPAFSWVWQTIVLFSKRHWGHFLVVIGEDEHVVLVDVLCKLDAFIFLELPIHCQFHNLRLEVVMGEVLAYGKIIIFWRKIQAMT